MKGNAVLCPWTAQSVICLALGDATFKKAAEAIYAYLLASVSFLGGGRTLT